MGRLKGGHNKPKNIEQLTGKPCLPAREVSKQTCPDSIGKSVVQVHNLAPVVDKKYTNDYPIENAKTLSKEELKQLNLNVKNENLERNEIIKFLELNNNLQLQAIKENFIPNPILEEYNLPFQYINFVNTASSALVKNRPGRSLKFLIKDKKYNFIYVILTAGSPMVNRQINKYLNQKLKYTFLNKHLIDINVCVGVGILTTYLSGKMMILMALSSDFINIWNKKYNTDIKYIMTTSIYGKSSIYNRLPDFNYLGLTEGWNALFSSEQTKWVREQHKIIYPHLYITEYKIRGSHPYRKWNEVWRKYHDKMPFFPYKTQRGTYIFDTTKTSTKSIEENIKYWITRWYLPRKERIEKGEINNENI